MWSALPQICSPKLLVETTIITFFSSVCYLATAWLSHCANAVENNVEIQLLSKVRSSAGIQQSLVPQTIGKSNVQTTQSFVLHVIFITPEIILLLKPDTSENNCAR